METLAGPHAGPSVFHESLNRTLSGPPVSTESTFVRPSQETRRHTFSRPLPVVSNGLTKVLSVLTGGPDKVRFKKNSQIRCTLAKSGLEKVCGSRRREVVFRVAISRGLTCFYQFVLGPVAEGPPECYMKKTRVENGLDGVFFCFRVFDNFSYLP